MKVPPLRSVHRRWLLALLCAVPLDAASDPIDTVEKAARDWVKMRAETVRLETEWTTQHELLDSMVKALNERAQDLEEKRDNLKARTAKDRNELAALEGKNQTADQELRTTDGRLRTLGESLGQLRPMLPPRLSAALEMPYRSLANPDLGPARTHAADHDHAESLRCSSTVSSLATKRS